MRADNSDHLKAAAARRSEDTRRRAEATLDEMLREGVPVSAATLCRRARVSRSWLYSQPALLSEIARHRPRAPQRAPGLVPRAQRASDASLLQRLRLAQERLHEATEENRNLKEQLAYAYGQLRQARILGLPAAEESATVRPATTLGPCS